MPDKEGLQDALRRLDSFGVYVLQTNKYIFIAPLLRGVMGDGTEDILVKGAGEAIAFATVSFEFEGLHHYPGATDDEQAPDHLENLHRHKFHVKVEIEQSHDNRDVEYLGFRQELKQWVEDEYGRPASLAHLSCEMFGRVLLDYILREYGSRRCKVEVTEDGENGAILKANHD